MSVKDWWNGTDSGKTKDFVRHKPHIHWPGIEPGSPRREAGEEQHEALHSLWRKEKWDWRRKISGVSYIPFRMSGILLPWRQMKNRLCSCFIICMNGRIICLNAKPRHFSSERFGWQPKKMLLNSSYRVSFHQIYLLTYQPVHFHEPVWI